MTTTNNHNNKEFSERYNSTNTPPDRDPDFTYVYRNELGGYEFEVRRWGTGESKAFSLGHYVSPGNVGPGESMWQKGYGPAGPILYRLPDILAADIEQPIWICEGEKDAETLSALGELATTNPFGARAWLDSFSEPLTGRHLILVEDNDNAGRSRTAWLRRTLRKVAATISVVRFEDMPEKSDISDAIAAGQTLDDLKARIEKLEELIFISTKIAEMVDRIEEQLIRSGAEIYARSDSLVRVITDKGNVMLREMTPHDLRDHISRHCAFAKFNAKGDQVPAAPTLDMANTLLARVGKWAFPEINGVHTAPLITPKGAIIDKPGFDPATGLYLALPSGEIQIGETREEAEKALAAIHAEILGEFATVDEIDLSVLMAGLLTPLVRAVIPVAPMIAVRASTPGSGKSFYVDCVSMLAQGQKASGLTLTQGNDEENKKLLSAVAMEGKPIIALDNVNGVIRGDFIAQLIERSTVKPRILGKSEAPTIANVFSMFANGNNLIIQGDLTRRVLLANLDAKMERPETREFKSDPLKLIEENREKWLGYALTIIRAYLKSGDHIEAQPFGSFAAWGRLVRSPLIWLGMADPVESVVRIRGEDPELTNIAGLFAAWPEHGSSFTAGELVTKAENEFGGPLKIALLQVAANGRDGINSQKLGYYLRSIKGRIVGNFVLDGGPSSAANSNRYQLKAVA